MKLKRILLSISFILSFSTIVLAQDPPKRELRATWLATVDKIDWPKVSGEANQKNALITILNKLESANMTSAFFQIRPMADAFYKSNYEPWSQYLTGTRGKDPGYDPLEFAIEEAHKRGIEIHAWMNPYRYETGSMNHGSEDYVRKNHPDWILTYSDRRILDPGNPEVREYIINIVEDVVKNYNVDGIIFDDYYYPYSGTTNEDIASQNKYKDPSMNVGDWRRQNVDELIAGIYKKIQETKPTVKFSQGPFGIWGASQAVADEYGIPYLNTSGGTNAYASIYCDAVGWIKDKIVDFISPQCYWPSTNTNAWGYSTLVPWWSKVAGKMDRHFYSSMRMGTMGTKSTHERPANIDSLSFEGLSYLEQTMLSSVNSGISLKSAATDECDYEVDLNRSTNEQDAPGHVFFNTTQFISYGFPEHLKSNKFSRPALTPTMTWKTPTLLATLSNIKVENNILTWEGETSESDRFAIYLIPSENIDNADSYESSLYLKKITWSKSLDISQYSSLLSTHKFAITIVDGHGYESAPYKEGTGNSIENEHFSKLSITVFNGYIEISTETPLNVKIYSALGQKIRESYVDKTSQISLPAGVYLVNDKKVIVK